MKESIFLLAIFFVSTATVANPMLKVTDGIKLESGVAMYGIKLGEDKAVKVVVDTERAKTQCGCINTPETREQEDRLRVHIWESK